MADVSLVRLDGSDVGFREFSVPKTWLVDWLEEAYAGFVDLSLFLIEIAEDDMAALIACAEADGVLVADEPRGLVVDEQER